MDGIFLHILEILYVNSLEELFCAVTAKPQNKKTKIGVSLFFLFSSFVIGV
jgi:hypothetical protein